MSQLPILVDLTTCKERIRSEINDLRNRKPKEFRPCQIVKKCQSRVAPILASSELYWLFCVFIVFSRVFLPFDERVLSFQKAAAPARK